MKNSRITFICSPYRGDVEYNVNQAQLMSKYIAYQNDVPIAPHLLFTQFLDDNDYQHREMALKMNKRIIDICDVVLVMEGEITEGMQIEIDYAKSIGKEIHTLPDDIWRRG